ncbi:hypothetical protein ACFL6S_18450 [Candidatus Poribacteria bacterium]
MWEFVLFVTVIFAVEIIALRISGEIAYGDGSWKKAFVQLIAHVGITVLVFVLLAVLGVSVLGV